MLFRSIIETGLDISNVNTIIIHDADQMGLSQLYQLRGRVGRSNRTAYAFLMYRRNKMLKEIAEKRLHAIREFTELGSGIKIAMRDLELRGAGNHTVFNLKEDLKISTFLEFQCSISQILLRDLQLPRNVLQKLTIN